VREGSRIEDFDNLLSAPPGDELSDPRNIIGSLFQRKIKYSCWNSLEFPRDIGIIRTVGTTMTADARCTPDLQWIAPPRRLLWGIVTDRG
jgi:hypothetical protein